MKRRIIVTKRNPIQQQPKQIRTDSVEITDKELQQVTGGTHKHLAGVKYEDITINSGPNNR
jgi:bacteriocin-like protein